jgi:replication factor C subunit 2/4
VKYNDDGLTALIFTAEGDMRQAINNLQSTHAGFGFVSGENVFKVCDQPHPILVQQIVRACHKADVDEAMTRLTELWDQGYSAVDIVVTVFRVVKTFDECVAFLSSTSVDAF